MTFWHGFFVCYMMAYGVMLSIGWSNVGRRRDIAIVAFSFLLWPLLPLASILFDRWHDDRP